MLRAPARKGMMVNEKNFKKVIFIITLNIVFNRIFEFFINENRNLFG